MFIHLFIPSCVLTSASFHIFFAHVFKQTSNLKNWRPEEEEEEEEASVLRSRLGCLR